MARIVNQEANFASDFGAVFRSSAIFYKLKNIKTIISFCNYWGFKNNLEVGLTITFRNMCGDLVKRKEIEFSKGNVINLTVEEIEEGSVEIEVFSSKNLRIPFAAIMCVYETENSISMVHTYGRNHSLIELEDNKAITEARESCWTLRPSLGIRNQAIFHNGHVGLDKQVGLFIVTKSDGSEIKIEFDISALAPFETVVFDAEEIFPQLIDFLDGSIGWGTIHFESRSSFTRLLILWIDDMNKEIQVAHSNFDYSAHKTNLIKSEKPAYMALPTVYGQIPDVIVYPKFSKGVYVVNSELEFDGGIELRDKGDLISFMSKKGDLPARIVTSVTNKFSSDASLPYECSIGVVHERRPLKRFHWFLISSEFSSVIHLTAYDKIYPIEKELTLVFRLYSEFTKDISEVTLSYRSLADMPKEIKVDELFDLKSIRGFGYASIFSQYGGLFVYSSLRKNNSIAIEHAF